MAVEVSSEQRVKVSEDEICIISVAATTALGIDIESTWRGVAAGQCGIGAMSELESPVSAGRDGGQALPLPVEYEPELPREARYLRWTIDSAIRSAGENLQLGNAAALPPARVSLVLGTTLHGMRAGGQFLRTGDYSKLKSFLAGDVAHLATNGLPIGGARLTTCSACSSSLGAVALGVTLLRTAESDLIIAGGYDAISEYAYAGFDALRLVSEAPLRPFARDRSGMKVGEGYGIVLMMRRSDAERAGLDPLAIVAGYGESADAFHLTRPHPEGVGAFAAMQQAIGRAGITPHDLDLIAAHATGTVENDKSEAAAIIALLGEDSRRVPIVGLKSHLGHTLGGAGAIELALSVQAIRNGIVPPTANPCEVEYERLAVNSTARRQAVRHTLNTSLGFGGANTCVVLRAPDVPQKRETAGEGSGERPKQWQIHPETSRLPSRARGREVVITGVGVLLPKSGRTIDDGEYESIVPNARRLRRMSTYVKLSIAAATMAARDARLLDAPDLLRETGAILGTTHGSAGYCYEYYAQIVREGMPAANPMLFAEGVPNAAAAQLSLTLGLCGACQTILGTRTAGLDALRLAALRISAGEANRLVVCAAEESHPVLDAAYAAVCGGPESVSLAVAFVLESREASENRGVTALARVSGGAFAHAIAGESRSDLLRRAPCSGERIRPTSDFANGSAFSVEPLLALARVLRDPAEAGRSVVAADRQVTCLSFEPLP